MKREKENEYLLVKVKFKMGNMTGNFFVQIGNKEIGNKGIATKGVIPVQNCKAVTLISSI